jgi:hypothetical protein
MGAAESLEVTHYQQGEPQHAHHDWQSHSNNTRFATIIFYLDDLDRLEREHPNLQGGGNGECVVYI